MSTLSISVLVSSLLRVFLWKGPFSVLVSLGCREYQGVAYNGMENTHRTGAGILEQYKLSLDPPLSLFHVTRL